MHSRKVFLTVASLLISSAAFGQVDFNSLGQTTTGSVLPNPTETIGESFLNGPTAVTVSGFTLSLSNQGHDSNVFYVSSGPDVNLGGGRDAISDSEIGSTPTLVTVWLAPLFVPANSRFWLGLSNFDNSDVSWDFTTDTSGPGVASEFHFEGYNNIIPNAGNGAFQVQVLTGVPEPSSLAFLGLGVPLAFLRRKKPFARP